MLSDAAQESSQSGDPTAPRRQLSIDDLTSLLITEAQYRTHRLLKEDIEKSWDRIVEHEWSRARDLERTAQNAGALRRTVATATFPYLVCDVEVGKPGESCRATVEKHFGSHLMVSDM
jgi:hypothetical protein